MVVSYAEKCEESIGLTLKSLKVDLILQYWCKVSTTKWYFILIDIWKIIVGLSIPVILKLLINVYEAKFYEDFRNIVFNTLKLCTKSQ